MEVSVLPRHVAIIMDGNGRWARKRGWQRTFGHREGADRVDEVVTACCELGIPYLTLYAFSTENWKRPQTEVQFLMALLVDHLKRQQEKLLRNEVSLYAMGSLQRLPANVQRALGEVIAATTRPNPKLRLCLSLSYGAREEIVAAARKLCVAAQNGLLDPQALSEEAFSRELYLPEFPDPDLIIRTAGESRLSNFLLWQAAYSEIYISPVLWPEFSRSFFEDALRNFAGRERRFGDVEPAQGCPV